MTWVTNNLRSLKSKLTEEIESQYTFSSSSLTWNGDGTDYFQFESYHRLSDIVPSIAETQAGGVVIITSPSTEYAGTFEFTADDIVVELNPLIYSVVPANGNALSTLLVCLEDTTLTGESDSAFIKKGLYVTGNVETGYPSVITFNNFSFQRKKLASELISEHVVTYDALNDIYNQQQKTESDLAAEIATKQDLILGAASTITQDNLNNDVVVVSNSSGKVSSSQISTNELVHLSGLTTNVQETLDSLEASLGDISTALNSILGV